MKPTQLTEVTEKLIAVELKVMDKLVADFIEPLAYVGNPERLIKKPYAQWTPEDLQLLIKIYGTGDDTPLTKTIFNRTYERVKELEAEEK